MLKEGVINTTTTGITVTNNVVTDFINAWLGDGAMNTYLKRVPTIHDHCHATAR
jgi:hypothetical protein